MAERMKVDLVLKRNPKQREIFSSGSGFNLTLLR